MVGGHEIELALAYLGGHRALVVDLWMSPQAERSVSDYCPPSWKLTACRWGEQSSSFLKKEPKNFCSFGWSLSGKAEAKTDKSFLLLFFKKEDLSFALKFIFPSRQDIFKMKDSGHYGPNPIRPAAGPGRISASGISVCHADQESRGRRRRRDSGDHPARD
jgi:hypothetical protein